MTAFFLLMMAFSCKEEVGNPGDFSIKTTLEVTGVNLSSGAECPFEIKNIIDSAIVRSYLVYDTLKDESGIPVLGSNGQYTIDTDTCYYVSRTRCRFIDIEEIVLDYKADTVCIDLKSNAKWSAPMPELGTPPIRWFVTQNLSGGGDGTVMAAVPVNKNVTRPNKAVQYIYTPDSTVMYRFTFGQKGEKDK